MNEGLLRSVAAFVMTLCLVSFALAAEDKEASSASKDKCPVCGMVVAPYAGWHATVEFKDSTRVILDGPKDMFKYYLDLKKYNPSKGRADISAISVKDYYSQIPVDARKAYFVIWSDVYGPMGHEPIPFEKERDAKRFMKEHKGKKVLRFSGITLQLLSSLDNP